MGGLFKWDSVERVDSCPCTKCECGHYHLVLKGRPYALPVYAPVPPLLCTLFQGIPPPLCSNTRERSRSAPSSSDHHHHHHVCACVCVALLDAYSAKMMFRASRDVLGKAATDCTKLKYARSLLGDSWRGRAHTGG